MQWPFQPMPSQPVAQAPKAAAGLPPKARPPLLQPAVRPPVEVPEDPLQELWAQQDAENREGLSNYLHPFLSCLESFGHTCNLEKVSNPVTGHFSSCRPFSLGM